MAKKANEGIDVGRIAHAYGTAYGAIANSGSHMLVASQVLHTDAGDSMITKEQADAIIASVTTARGWADGGRNPKPRQSSLRNALRTFREAERAVNKWLEMTGSSEIGYDDWDRLSRKLSQERGSPKAWGDKAPPVLTDAQVTAAVTAAIEDSEGKGSKAKKNPTKAGQRDEAVKLLGKLKELRSNWMPKGFHADVDKLLAKFE